MIAGRYQIKWNYIHVLTDDCPVDVTINSEKLVNAFAGTPTSGGVWSYSEPLIVNLVDGTNTVKLEGSPYLHRTDHILVTKVIDANSPLTTVTGS